MSSLLLFLHIEGGPWPSGSRRFPVLVHTAAKSPRLSDLPRRVSRFSPSCHHRLIWSLCPGLCSAPPSTARRYSFPRTGKTKYPKSVLCLKITNLFAYSSGGQKSKTEGFRFQRGHAPADGPGRRLACLFLLPGPAGCPRNFRAYGRIAPISASASQGLPSCMSVSIHDVTPCVCLCPNSLRRRTPVTGPAPTLLQRDPI